MDLPVPYSGPIILDLITVLFLNIISPAILVFPYTSIAFVIDSSLYIPFSPLNTQSVPICRYLKLNSFADLTIFKGRKVFIFCALVIDFVSFSLIRGLIAPIQLIKKSGFALDTRFESPVEVASKLIISPFKYSLIGSSLRDVKKSFPDDFCEKTLASIFPSMPSIPKIKILLKSLDYAFPKDSKILHQF